MIAFILALVEVFYGGAVVCAEAGGEHRGERVAVAEVIRNRVLVEGKRPLHIFARRAAFARPCNLRRFELHHVRDYLDGMTGGGPGWGAIAFYALRRHDALETRWTARGWRIVARTEAHVYWGDE